MRAEGNQTRESPAGVCEISKACLREMCKDIAEKLLHQVYFVLLVVFGVVSVGVQGFPGVVGGA